ncbi:EFH1 [Candida theae]|uniref:EFH1 n=1 Tax=Candida theae TaxID=1198502 RepID=A0AAD5FYQ7_9ASCO|nr:EFH1 [Candida theae]KAI5958200.1 EFH1 [Candida theae]
MNEVMETSSSSNFYGSDLVTSSKTEQVTVDSKKNLPQSEPEKIQNVEQQLKTRVSTSQPPKQTNNQASVNSIDTPYSHQFQSVNKVKGQQAYPMDYSNYYSIQSSYPAMQNIEFLNSSSSVTATNAGFPDFQSSLTSLASPVAQNVTQEVPIAGLKPQQYAPSHTPSIYSTQNPYSIFQQQDVYPSSLGNKTRSTQYQQKQNYPMRNERQNYNSSQVPYQSDKIGFDGNESWANSRYNQQLLLLQQQQQQQQPQQQQSQQSQQSQHSLNQAFSNSSPMSYSQTAVPQNSLSYNSPAISSNYHSGYAAQRSFHQPQYYQQQQQQQQQQMSKSKSQSALTARNQSVSSTITNKSRNSSTFSNSEEPSESRTTSISSCIPQDEPKPKFVKPLVATRSWEEENTNCYQVCANRVLVSRREDNNYINCTKLLNVTNMSRGKRDGILKTEKVKNVIKVGSMNLKGVWIPFDRAFEIARNEGIDELLHPLFVRNIKEYFLTEGYKLKNEKESKEPESRRSSGSRSNRSPSGDEPNGNYEKSSSSPEGEQATSLPSNGSKDYDFEEVQH